MLHLAEGGNNGGHRWWFDNAVARGVPFDVIGVSHYIFWHGTLGRLQFNLNDLSARYGKDIAVMETAYGFTLAENDAQENIFNASLERAGGYPATPQGQLAFRDVFTVVAAVPDGRGLGVFYWEPTWTAVEGAGWDPNDITLVMAIASTPDERKRIGRYVAAGHVDGALLISAHAGNTLLEELRAREVPGRRLRQAARPRAGRGLRRRRRP